MTLEELLNRIHFLPKYTDNKKAIVTTACKESLEHWKDIIATLKKYKGMGYIFRDHIIYIVTPEKLESLKYCLYISDLMESTDIITRISIGSTECSMCKLRRLAIPVGSVKNGRCSRFCPGEIVSGYSCDRFVGGIWVTNSFQLPKYGPWNELKRTLYGRRGSACGKVTARLVKEAKGVYNWVNAVMKVLNEEENNVG
jgi:hypothetical protein